MDIKNFRLKTKHNYKKVNCSSFCDENSFFDHVAQQLSNGVDALELEENKLSSKQFLSIAKKTRELCSIYDALFFINDRCDITFLCEADGVVLSKESISLENAKNILGENFMYGYLIENKKEITNQYDFYVSENAINNREFDKPYFIRK